MAVIGMLCLRPSFIKSFKFWTPSMRLKSDAHVAMTDDSSTIVCWHPETKFPYEKSLPIPESTPVKSDSVLKIQSNKEFLSLLKPKRQEVVIKELTDATFTTKHIWFPRKKQFKRKKPAGQDRPYL